MVIQGALEGDLDDHLGYAKHEPEGRDGGNSRNGHRAKTVITDTGPVEISVPRDRDSSFDPKIVAKKQRRLTGVDDMIISLSAKGLTHGEIAAHLAEARRAGTSRPVLARRWPSRPELVIAALRRHRPMLSAEIPDTGGLRDDVLAVLRRTSSGLAEAGPVTIYGLLSDYFADPPCYPICKPRCCTSEAR